MRITTVAVLLAWAACGAAPAAGQNAGAYQPLPPNPNAPPISDQSRYRYQNYSWRYRNPSLFPSYGQGNEWAEYEPHAYGQWFNNRLRPPTFSRYSLGYRSQWDPYRGYRYGYSPGFGGSYYGYGSGYYGLRNGYLGYGGNGYFSNGAYSTGD